MKLHGVALAVLLMSSAASAQNAARVIAPPSVAPPKSVATAIDYQTMYQREVDKNKQLKGEVASLTQRINEMTRPGGSLVQAYCESPTVSRNTAGATSDCARNGFACEPVSGLCRTSARSSDECAATFVYCSTTGGCVRDARACPSG